MPHNNSTIALNYLQDFFNRALEEPHGLKITCKNHGEAMALRSRLNYYRLRDRQLNGKTYPEDHPMHKVSVWDSLSCHVGKAGAPDEAIVLIKPIHFDRFILESLTPPPDSD